MAKKTIKKKKDPKVLNDLDALKALFQVVERGKLTWEATFDAIRDPVMIITGDYRIERANLAAGETANQKIVTMIGRHCYEVFAGRASVCPRCPLAETLERNHPHSIEVEKLRKETDFQVNSYPLPLESGGVKRVVHHYRDVTAERLLQRQLVQSEKMAAIGMLAGGVAHEINNPLGGVLAFTQLLKSELAPENPAQDDLKEIEEAAVRCKKIVSDLLSFSRPSAGRDRVPQDINGLVERVMPMLRLHLREAQVMIKTEYGKNLPPVLGDASRLQQVFMNLIRNAAEAMKEGGAVTIRTRLSPDSSSEFAVEFEDTGHGINPQDLDHIFDPFFTTKGHKGTGLGLSICDSIIHDHHGRIEVRSELGKGSLFRVLLPVCEAERAS
ncbi:MAG: PAS domain-containing protein [Deltaproteobacteria bacterium]|nr:PAS domain-containing protein [Deltaproteobacteria bacterium]MBI4374247.1 PAS domain-containing protein [Deltaproteobacteria bacterium]